MARLDELCSKASSNIAQKDLVQRNGEYPIFGASGLIKHVDFYQQERPYIAVVKDGAGVGRVMQLPGKSSVIGTMQYIIPNEGVSVSYLAYAMEHLDLARYYTGATIPHIYFKDYCRESLRSHSTEEQRRIAAVLNQTSKLISLRKQQLAKLDELVKVRFVEMFGDPVRNNKNFITARGAAFLKLSNGKPVLEEKRRRSGIPAYGGNGISWYTDEALFPKDTLVIGRVGFQSGNVHLARGPLWVTDNAMYVAQYDAERYDLEFLYALMNAIDFTRFQDAGDLKKVTQKPFLETVYIQPPLSIQRRFAAFVERTDRAKALVQQSLAQLETLKKSLMQDYFG